MNKFPPKPQSKSLTIIGAVLTIVSTLGMLPFAFDINTGDVSFNIYTIGGSLVGLAPVGAALSWYGRLRAKSPIKGLF